MITNRKGFAVFFVTIIVLMAMFGIVMNIALVAYLQSQIIRNVTRSTQAYFAAEAGIEDALWKLGQRPTSSASSYDLDFGGVLANIDISSAIGGSRTIIAEGSVGEILRKVRVIWSITSQQISFFYGAQIGDGGLVMGNSGALIKGNVFSNGNIIVAGGGKCSAECIEDSVIVAHNGNKIDGLIVGGNAMVHTCVNSDIAGELTYVSGGSYASCTYSSSVKERPNEIDPALLPINSAQVQEWKDDASENVFAGNYILGNGDSVELGPIKIQGDLTLENNSHLTLKGTVYATGNIVLSPGAIVDLDPGYYSSLGGIIIAENRITVGNGASLNGTGEAGSYILLVSESNSLDPASPAIFVGNTAEGAIFYTNYGLILLNNNMSAREITGYKVWINNNAVVEYESGLENANFASGPGGGWQIKSWREIE